MIQKRLLTLIATLSLIAPNLVLALDKADIHLGDTYYLMYVDDSVSPRTCSVEKITASHFVSDKYYDDWVVVDFLPISREALKIGPSFLENSYVVATAEIALCNFLTPLTETFSSN